MDTSISHSHDVTFVTTLKRLYGDLQARLSIAKPREPLQVEVSGSRYLCVWNDLQDQLDRLLLRHQIEALLGPNDIRIIQLVGDSNSAFSLDGIAKVKDLLIHMIDETLPDNRHTVLEYGYTAGKHDTNWILNDIIAARPELGMRTVANIVGISAVAVEDWGAEATSLVRNFVLAYDEVETMFGSDVWLSDDVMFSSYGDRLVCVEGGPQAFAQAVSVCSRGVSVMAITGADLRQKSLDTSSERFSAARLLAMLRDAFVTRSSSESRNVHGGIALEEVASEYLNNCFELRNEGDVKKYGIVMAALEIMLKHANMIEAIEVVVV